MFEHLLKGSEGKNWILSEVRRKVTEKHKSYYKVDLRYSGTRYENKRDSEKEEERGGEKFRAKKVRKMCLEKKASEREKKKIFFLFRRIIFRSWI